MQGHLAGAIEAPAGGVAPMQHTPHHLVVDDAPNAIFYNINEGDTNQETSGLDADS